MCGMWLSGVCFFFFVFCFFFFNDTATTEIYTLSLHDALPISESLVVDAKEALVKRYAIPAIKANALYENRYPLSTALARPLIAKLLVEAADQCGADAVDRKSTRLNSSHSQQSRMPSSAWKKKKKKKK